MTEETINDGLNLYSVTVPWSGYSRGVTEYSVRAKSEDEAKERYYMDGEQQESETIRDDTEDDRSEAEVTLIEEAIKKEQE